MFRGLAKKSCFVIVALFVLLALPAGNEVQAKALGWLLVVNTTDDVDDGSCTVNHCSLREAINTSNAMPTPDTIHFNIRGVGPHIITPLTNLPSIQDKVVIDATSEPDFVDVGLYSPPVVVLNGAAKLVDQGLVVRWPGNGSIIKGMSFINFDLVGISLFDSSDNLVEDNYIGILPDGTPAGNLNGLYVLSGPDAKEPAAHNTVRENVVAGNEAVGIYISGELADENVVIANLIGVRPNNKALGNGTGVLIDEGADGNQIGGSKSSLRNVIADNGSRGIGVDDKGTDQNVIEGNFIGVDITGKNRMANREGIVLLPSPGPGQLGAAGTQILNNVISGNTIQGISIFNAIDTVIAGNLIGTDVDGKVGIGNGGSGVSLAGFDTVQTRIGGATIRERNVIAGNRVDGITIQIGPVDTLVQCNYVGVAADGKVPLPNLENGIDMGWDHVYTEIFQNRIANHTNPDKDKGIAIRIEDGKMVANDNLIYDNHFGAVNLTGIPLDATRNWWGAADGPSGAGPGSGDSISTDVLYAPFLVSDFEPCR